MLCDPGLLQPEPLLPGRPPLAHASAGDTQTLKGMSGSVPGGSLGLGVHKVFFEPFLEPLILMQPCPSYCPIGASSLPLDMGSLLLV